VITGTVGGVTTTRHQSEREAKMHLYSLTLQKASSISSACAGSFSDPKTQEIVAAKGKIIELLRPLADRPGSLAVVSSTEVFGSIRSIIPFRLPGM
jgi:splicing factor 3B subunit 3